MIVWIPGLQLDLFAKLCGKFFTWRPGQLFFFLRWIMWSLTGHWSDEGGKSAWKNDISTTYPVTCAVRSRLFVCFCLSTHVSNVRVRARFFLIASHCVHTSYLSREPRVYPCKFFLAGVKFYRFNAKNWHFWQILHEKVAFFYRFNAKNWRFSV